MQTPFSAPNDWDDEDKKNDEEDLGALGMSVKDADADDEIEDEETATPLPVTAVEEEEPLDGLAALEKMEAALKDDEPEIDVGEEE